MSQDNYYPKSSDSMNLEFGIKLICYYSESGATNDFQTFFSLLGCNR